jgi:glycosyltransferase involved in cell wall biosynthesis
MIGVVRGGWLRSQATSAGIPCLPLDHPGRGDLGVLGRLLDAVDSREIALIHAHEFYMSVIGAVVSRVAGVPLVITVHGKNYYPDRRHRRTAFRLAATLASAVVTVSEDLRRFFCRTTRAPLERVQVVYNGIEAGSVAERRRNVALLESFGIPRDARIVGTVGNLYPVKGHLELIRATKTIVSHHPGTHVVILGRGALRDHLVAEAEALGIGDRVHLVGYRDDVREWLSAMDVFTLPSRSEGLPLSLLEAMAAAVPPVVTAVGGMPEVVTDGESGFIVPPGDAARLSDRISAILGDPTLAETLAAAARARVLDRFTLETEAAAYQRVYDQAIGRSQAGRSTGKGLRTE